MGHSRQPGNRDSRAAPAPRVVKKVPKPKELRGSIYGIDDKPTQQLTEIADDLLFRLEDVSPDVHTIYVEEMKIDCKELANIINDHLDDQLVTQLLNNEFGKGVLLGIVLGQKAEQLLVEINAAVDEESEDEDA